MSKVKLEIAVQNLRSLERRAKQTRQSIDVAELKATTIRAEIENLKQRAFTAEATAFAAGESLKGILEYRDEIAQMVRRLFWELKGSDADSLDSSQKAGVYHQFLVDHNLGDPV